jgi:hypothetical protein
MAMFWLMVALTLFNVAVGVFASDEPIVNGFAAGWCAMCAFHFWMERERAR